MIVQGPKTSCWPSQPQAHPVLCCPPAWGFWSKVHLRGLQILSPDLLLCNTFKTLSLPFLGVSVCSGRARALWALERGGGLPWIGPKCFPGTCRHLRQAQQKSASTLPGTDTLALGMRTQEQQHWKSFWVDFGLPRLARDRLFRESRVRRHPKTCAYPKVCPGWWKMGNTISVKESGRNRVGLSSETAQAPNDLQVSGWRPGKGGT